MNEVNSYVLSWIFYTCRRVRCRRLLPQLWRHCLVFNCLQIDRRFRTFSPYPFDKHRTNCKHCHPDSQASFKLDWTGLIGTTTSVCQPLILIWSFMSLLFLRPLVPLLFLSPLLLFLPVESPNIPLMSVMFLLSLSLFWLSLISSKNDMT